MTIENSFLNQFDPKIKTEVIEFGKRLSNTKADVYLLMARKAVCFVNCLQELNLVNIDGIITSERILDSDTSWLRDKTVVIVDDTIISGTTLYKTIKKLKHAHVKQIDVFVLTVDNENFVPSLLFNEEENRSYLSKPYLSLNHTECIKVCCDIVNALSIFPRPYDTDYPYFDKINVLQSEFNDFIAHTSWTVENATSYLQDRYNTFTYTFTPNISAKVAFNEVIGFDISEFALLKVRTYGHYKNKSKSTYSVRILPIVVLKPLSFSDIDKLFNALVEFDEINDFRQINTYTSKLRFIQYFLSSKLAELWIESLSFFSNKNVNIKLNHNVFTLKLLFNEELIAPFLRLVSSRQYPLIQTEFTLSKVELNDNNDYVEKFPVIDDSIESLQFKLVEPFLSLYYDKELVAWNLVKEKGKKAFGDASYQQILNRLEKGYSIDFLSKLLKEYKDINPLKMISSFLDRAIDSGIAVPIIVSDHENSMVYRAYRHGEDVPFGEKEQKLLAIVIKAFSEAFERDTLQRIWVEKLSVLLIKIGIQNKFINPIITNVPSRDMLTSSRENKIAVASIKSYLYGPVTTYHEYEIGDSIESKSYIESGQNNQWLTHALIQKHILIKDDDGLYKFNQFPNISLDENLEGKCENIGLIFGDTMKKGLLDEKNDLVKLTACVYPNEIVQALAAEINIFITKWPLYQSYLERNLNGQEDLIKLAEGIRKKNIFFTAINSGQQKFFWFLNKAGQQLIDEIKEKITPKPLKNIWAEYWSPNKDWTVDSIDENLYNCIITEGMWILSMSIYVRILDITLRQLSFKRQSLKTTNDIVQKSKDLEKYLQKLLAFKSNSRVREIIPFTQKFISTYQHLTIHELEKNIPFVLMKIKALINGAKVILDDADLFVNKFGKIEEIKRYTNTLYIDINEKEFYQKKAIWNEIQIYVDNYTQKLIKQSDHSDSFLQIPNEKNILSRGFWYCSTGSTSSKNLIELADLLLKEFSDRINLKCVVFSQLPEELRIKSTSKDKSKFKYGNFWLQVSILNELNPLIFSMESESSELITITEDKDILMDEFEKLSKIKRAKYNKFPCKLYDTDTFTSSKYKINKYQMNPENHSNIVDIGIITVVSQETRAVLKFLEIDSKDDKVIDGRSFYEGVYNNSNNCELKIVVTQQLEPGNRSVVAAYNSLVKNFRPKLIVIVGIAGGISQDLNLCDVVIANQVIYYENRKESKDKTNRRGDVFKVDPKIKQLISKFFVTHDEPASFEAGEDSRKHQFKVLAGPIGSGEAVIADDMSSIKVWLQEVNSKCLAVEMEAGGFFQAFYEDGLTEEEPKNGAIVIRGISDHADFEKDDKWRKPASENAVKCLFELINLM